MIRFTHDTPGDPARMGVRMRKWLIGVIAGLLAAGAVPAQAQQQQQRPPSDPNASRAVERDLPRVRRGPYNLVERAQVEELFQDPAAAAASYNEHLSIAGCIVGLSGTRAAALLGGPHTDDPEFSDLYNAVLGRYRTCIRGREPSELSRSLLNAAIAEKLVTRERLAAASTQGDAERAAAFHGPLTEPLSLDTIVRCAVSRSPQLARRVLDTAPASAEEAAALGTLYAATPECGIAQAPEDVPTVVQRALLAPSLLAWGDEGADQ